MHCGGRSAGGSRRPAGVGAFLVAQSVGQVEVALQRPREIAAHDGRVGQPAEARLDEESVDRHARVGANRGRAHVERVQREHAGGAVEHADGVGRGDDHLVTADLDGELSGFGEGAALVVDQRLRGRRFTLEHGADAGDQIGDQPGLPVAPCRRARCRGVRDRQRMQQVEQLTGPIDRVGHRGHGHRVAEVAAGRGVRQQQVVTGQGGYRRDIVGRQAHALPDPFGMHRADDRVLARVALADVVQQGAEQQQIGARHLAGELRGLRGRLEQMPVDGEAVHRIVLGLAAHGVPFGNEAGEQTGVIERLEHLNRGLAGAEHGDEVVAHVGRPRDRNGRRHGGEPFECEGAERQAVLGGSTGGAQGKPRVGARFGVAGENHLAVLGDDVLGEPDPFGTGRCGRAEQPAARRPGGSAGGLDAPPRHIQGVRHGAGRFVDAAQHPIAVRSAGLVEHAQRLGHAVVLLQAQDVLGTARAPVQLTAHVEQDGIRGAHRRGEVDELRGRERMQRLRVTQAAARVLQVGFEQEGRLTGAGPPRARQLMQLGGSLACRGPPHVENAGP